MPSAPVGNRALMVVLAAVLAVLLLAPAARAVEPGQEYEVARSEDSRSSFAYVFGVASVDRPESFRLYVDAGPHAPVDITYDVSCRLGRRSLSQETKLSAQSLPLDISLPLTIRRAEYCIVSASAEYTNYEQPGSLLLQMFATQYAPTPYFTRCQGPRYGPSGLLETHRLRCRAGAVLTSQALHKPAAQGHYVRVGRYSCVRNRRAIRCSSGSRVARFRGRFRRGVSPFD